MDPLHAACIDEYLEFRNGPRHPRQALGLEFEREVVFGSAFFRFLKIVGPRHSEHQLEEAAQDTVLRKIADLVDKRLDSVRSFCAHSGAMLAVRRKLLFKKGNKLSSDSCVFAQSFCQEELRIAETNLFQIGTECTQERRLSPAQIRS